MSCRTWKIQDGLRSEQLRLPVTVQRAYAATVCSLVAMIATTVEQIEHLERELIEHFHEPASTTTANAAFRTRPALRHVANRLVGILHGCLATRTTYDETTAWGHHTAAAAA